MVRRQRIFKCFCRIVNMSYRKKLYAYKNSSYSGFVSDHWSVFPKLFQGRLLIIFSTVEYVVDQHGGGGTKEFLIEKKYCILANSVTYSESTVFNPAYRHADYFSENSRTLYKAYGVNFVVNVWGRAGKFSPIPTLLNLGAGDY
jgi:hypothetical protein